MSTPDCVFGLFNYNPLWRDRPYAINFIINYTTDFINQIIYHFCGKAETDDKVHLSFTTADVAWVEWVKLLALLITYEHNAT